MRCQSFQDTWSSLKISQLYMELPFFFNDLIVEKLFEASGFYIDVSVRSYIDIMSAGAFCQNALLQLFAGLTVG